MINLTEEILWAQLALVGIGAILQLIAFRTFSRDPHVHGGVPEVPNRDVPDHSVDKTALPAEPPPVKAYHPPVDHTPHEPFSEFHASKLTKTKRCSFKQDFKGLH